MIQGIYILPEVYRFGPFVINPGALVNIFHRKLLIMIQIG